LVELMSQVANRLGVRQGDALFIEEVETTGPAASAELQRGYLLIAIDDRKTTNLRDVAEVITAKKKRDTVKLTVVLPRRLGAYVQLQQGTASVELR
jgi:S1-C subfamily serine protease